MTMFFELVECLILPYFSFQLVTHLKILTCYRDLSNNMFTGDLPKSFGLLTNLAGL